MLIPEEQPSCDLPLLLQSSIHLSIDWLLHSIMSYWTHTITQYGGLSILDRQCVLTLFSKGA